MTCNGDPYDRIAELEKQLEHAVVAERARIAKRLRCGWKHAGDDGVYDLLDELEPGSGFHSPDLDAAEELHTPKSEKP